MNKKCGILTRILTFILIISISNFLLVKATVIHEESPILLEVSSAKGKVGDIVKISVNIGENSTFGAGTFILRYDSEKLELKKSELGEMLKNHEGMESINDEKEGEIILAYITLEDVKEKGEILIAEFKLKEDFEGKSEISLIVDTLMSNAGDEIANKVNNGEISLTNEKEKSNNTEEDNNSEKDVSKEKVSKNKTNENQDNNEKTQENSENAEEEKLKEQTESSTNKVTQKEIKTTEKSKNDNKNNISKNKIGIIFVGVVILCLFLGIIIKKKRSNGGV